MAIQVRRGQLQDFDASKMVAGEWAVSVDNDTSRQQIFMCFAPNVVKRLGTFDDMEDELEPYVDSAKEYAENSEAYAVGTRNGEDVEETDETYHNNAKYYSEQAETYMNNAVYVFVRYSEHADGSDFVVIPSNVTYYIGIYQGHSATAPTDKSLYTWSRYVGVKGDTGATGSQGRGISSIVKSSTEGLIDTYTITYTDSTSSTFYVTNGQQGENGADGEDGFSPSATVTKVGSVATISITDKDGTTTATIRDGEDGAGSGDMLKATYDTNNNGRVDVADSLYTSAGQISGIDTDTLEVNNGILKALGSLPTPTDVDKMFVSALDEDTEELVWVEIDKSEFATNSSVNTLSARVTANEGNITSLQTDKADKSDTYSKDDTDALLDTKADADDTYTKTEVNSLVNAKADASNVYTKTETDNLLDDKVDIYQGEENVDKILKVDEDGNLSLAEESGGGSWGSITGTLSNQTDLQNALDSKQDEIVIHRGTLTAGQTSITISSLTITNNSVFKFFTSKYGVNPKTVTVGANSVTLTFDSQTENIEVGVEVNG